MAKLFAKFGAKRDQNLADLRNTTTALNTLLDRIKGGKRKFDVDDLKLIEGIFATDTTTATFTSAASATVKFTSSNGTQQVYEPLITLQNRFDRAYFTTSEPFFAGGDGFTARYFDNPQIKRQTGTDSTSNWTGYDQYLDPTTGRATIDPALGVERATDKDQFWEDGDFYYGNKIVNKLLTSYGGVEWTGFYKIREQGFHSIRIYTSGFVRIEFDNLQAPSKDFTFTPATGTFQLDDLDFKNPSGLTTRVDQTKLVGAGKITTATITGTTLTGGALNATYGNISTFRSSPAAGTGASFDISRDLNGQLYIANITPGADYVNGGTFIIDGALIGGTTGVTPGTGDDATITITGTGGYEIYDSIAGASTNYEIGQTRMVDVPLGILEPYVPYKIRISFFMDEDAVQKTSLTSTSLIQKFIQFQRIIPLVGVVDDFDYKYLFNERYFDFYNIGDFKQFIDDSISFAGSKVTRTKTIGKQTSTVLNGTGIAGDRYKTLANFNPIVSYYKAKLDTPISGMTVSRTGTYTANTFTVTITNTGLPNKTEGIEVGNYILANGILTGSRVSAVILNDSVVLDLPIQTSQTNATVTFVDHRGLVAFGKAGRYSDDIVTGGLVEKGFSFGSRGVAFVSITDGALTDISKANQSYGTFALGDATRPYNTNAGGTGATFSISRNQFGALQISVVAAGTGYSNFEYFTVDGPLIGNGTTDITFEIKALTDTFLVGKPEYNITEDLILKEANWPNTFQFSDQTDPSLVTVKNSSQSALVERFQTGNDAVRNIPRNCFVFKDQTASITALAGTDRIWYLYESFGLNNKALAPYCQGVYAKRILQKLTVVNGGSGYSANVTTGSGSLVTNVSGTGSGMRVYYLASGGSITYAWTVSDGTGYESGNVVTVSGGGANATLSVGYPANVGDTTLVLRLTDAKDLSVGQYAHLFPAVFFSGPDLNNLSSDVTITNITTPANAFDSASLVTISRPTAPVLNSAITYTPSVVTRITFSPTSVNKEVCFKPTDTSPPFSATSRGLSTSFNVSMVKDFTTRGGADAGVANPDGKLTYDKLEIETNTSTNEITTTTTDYIAGYVPLETPSGTFYMILSRTGTT